MNRKTMSIIAAVVVAAALAAAYALIKKNEEVRGIPVSGNIEADEVRISFRVAGKILERYAQEGDRIRKGQPLAKLDTDELEKIRAQALAAFRAQEFTFRRAREDYQRADNLFREGAVARQARDNAKTQSDAAKANLANLMSALELARTRLGFAVLSSPMDGYITVRSAEAGEVVQAGSPVFTAVDLNDIWLTAYVIETRLGRVRLGQAVDVTTDTYPGRKYRGFITFISPEAEFTPKQIQTPEERVKLVYRIKVRLENPRQELKPGMPAEGMINE